MTALTPAQARFIGHCKRQYRGRALRVGSPWHDQTIAALLRMGYLEATEHKRVGGVHRPVAVKLTPQGWRLPGLILLRGGKP